MALVVNTNVPSIKLQNNLTSVTSKMNHAMERMTTGKKINSALDDPAGLVISKGLETQVSGTQVVKDNVQKGTNLLKTADGNLDAIQTNLVRVRDLTLQAMNGGQTVTELQALQDEVQARLNENDRIAAGSKFNKFTLFSGEDTKVLMQIGTGATVNDKIEIENVFTAATTEALTTYEDDGGDTKKTAIADFKFVNGSAAATYDSIKGLLEAVDLAIDNVSTRRGTIGAVSARLDSASSTLDSQYENLSSAYSTIVDTDVAAESSNYVKYNILQQAAASLLSQANQTPQVALSLI